MKQEAEKTHIIIVRHLRYTWSLSKEILGDRIQNAIRDPQCHMIYSCKREQEPNFPLQKSHSR